MSSCQTDADLDAVMRAARVISGIVAESVAQCGDTVTMPQLRALVLIATRPEVNATDVARALDIHPSNATRVCDRLVESGLMDRGESPTDRRVVVLALTEAGAHLVRSVMDHRRRAFGRILDQMDAHQRGRLRQSLTEFAELAAEPGEEALFPL